MRKFLSAFTVVLLFVVIFSGTVSALEANSSGLVTVRLTINDIPKNHKTKEVTVGEFLHSLRIVLKDDEYVNVPLDTKITSGLRIEITNEPPVEEDQAEPNSITYKSADQPAQAPPTSTPTKTEKYELIVTKSPILFEREVVLTDSLGLDEEAIAQEGILGEVETTIKVGYTDGVETSRTVVSEKILKEPINEVIARGALASTPQPKHLIEPPVIEGFDELGLLRDEVDSKLVFAKELSMTATAFTAGFESTGKRPGDKHYGVTKSGLNVGKGVVAVDPRVIPLGTWLYVEGYGYSIAADTGSGVKGNSIDLYYESVDDAKSFGRKKIKVYVLAKE